MTVREALREVERRLEAANVPTPRVDSELLLAHVLRTTRSGIHAHLDQPLDGTWETLVARREAREPLAYILGEWGFRRLTLNVDPRVLVPRPETEVVVERCLELIRPLASPRVLDVGTGSGAVALSIAHEHPGAYVVAVDDSRDALAVAATNVEATGLGRRVEVLQHDLRHGVALGRFDLVVSNPPYVRADEIDELEPEVRDWEPRAALVGEGVDQQIAAAARTPLRAGGWVVLETAAGNVRLLARRLAALGYADVRITPDLTDVERVVEGRWPSTL